MTSAARDEARFASLSPGLLARKGHARPAMRSGFARPVDDLGWNDMGERVEPIASPPHVYRARIETTFANTAVDPTEAKVAFTLRLDPKRHLRLRLGCAVSDCSAQQLVLEALDRLLDTIPEIDALAAQLPAPKGRKRGEKA